MVVGEITVTGFNPAKGTVGKVVDHRRRRRAKSTLQ